MTKHRTLKGLRPETLQDAPPKTLTLLCQAYLAAPSWGGMFVLAFAQRSEVEEIASLYEIIASPSDVLELLGKGAASGDPARLARDELRVRWRGQLRELTREGIAAYLAARPAQLPGWLHARTLLQRLSDDDLRLVTLLFVEGFTQEEAATIFGVTERTIRNQITRIRDLLGGSETI